MGKSIIISITIGLDFNLFERDKIYYNITLILSQELYYNITLILSQEFKNICINFQLNLNILIKPFF